MYHWQTRPPRTPRYIEPREVATARPNEPAHKGCAGNIGRVSLDAEDSRIAGWLVCALPVSSCPAGRRAISAPGNSRPDQLWHPRKNHRVDNTTPETSPLPTGTRTNFAGWDPKANVETGSKTLKSAQAPGTGQCQAPDRVAPLETGTPGGQDCGNVPRTQSNARLESAFVQGPQRCSPWVGTARKQGNNLEQPSLHLAPFPKTAQNPWAAFWLRVNLQGRTKTAQQADSQRLIERCNQEDPAPSVENQELITQQGRPQAQAIDARLTSDWIAPC